TALAASFPPAAPWPHPANPPAFVAPGCELQPKGIREIVFRLSADLDNDGRIVSAATGNIEWGPMLVGYQLIPNTQGTLDLVRRRVTGANTRDEVICRGIEALTFDTVDTKNVLPMDAVEVHMHLKRKSTRGQIEKLHLSTTVCMRNSS